MMLLDVLHDVSLLSDRETPKISATGRQCAACCYIYIYIWTDSTYGFRSAEIPVVEESRSEDCTLFSSTAMPKLKRGFGSHYY